MMINILPILIILVSTIYSQSIASLVLAVVGLFIGNMLVIKLYPNDKSAMMIYNLIFSIFLSFTFFRYVDIMNHYEIFKNGNDEIHYWKEAIDGANYRLSYLWNEIFTYQYLEEKLYYFYVRSLSSSATIYFDGNSEYLQLLGTSIPGSYVSIFLYGVLHSYGIKKTYRKTLMFMVFSCLLPVSLIIHRDSLVALLFSISIYLMVVKHLSAKTIFLQVLLIIVTFFIREQSGLFLILLLLVSFYISSKNKIIWIIMGIILLCIMMPYYSFVIENYQNTVKFYNQYALDNVSDGLSSYIDKLPMGLKQFAQVIQGQFQPLPIWAKWPNRVTLYSGVLAILWSIISVYWFRIVSSTLYFTIKNLKRIPKQLIILEMLFFIFLFLNCSNADPRRMVCMYPICYLIFCYLKQNLIRFDEMRKFDKLFYSGIVAFMCLIIVLKS